MDYAIQGNLEFDLADLKKAMLDEGLLRGMVRKELCRLADICDLEPSFVLPMIPEVMDKVKEETKKFKFGPKEFFPLLSQNQLKIQITMPTSGKVGVLFWCSKVMV